MLDHGDFTPIGVGLTQLAGLFHGSTAIRQFGHTATRQYGHRAINYYPLLVTCYSYPAHGWLGATSVSTELRRRDAYPVGAFFGDEPAIAPESPSFPAGANSLLAVYPTPEAGYRAPRTGHGKTRTRGMRYFGYTALRRTLLGRGYVGICNDGVGVLT
jgi:hypothetical protein